MAESPVDPFAAYSWSGSYKGEHARILCLERIARERCTTRDPFPMKRDDTVCTKQLVYDYVDRDYRSYSDSCSTRDGFSPLQDALCRKAAFEVGLECLKELLPWVKTNIERGWYEEMIRVVEIYAGR